MKTAVQSAYRADIDGLRAIAILSVIVFHIDKRLIPGGFVGVDIFFVISGFLISLHILKDIERDRFSLVEFYRRRIKRLALPLLLVVLVTVFAAVLLMIPDDLAHTVNSALFALFSLANVYFWLYQDTSYFAADSGMLPLLHLWSLGVEEQFYIFWPLLLMFAYRRTRVRAFFMLAAAVALASFVFGEFWYQRDFSFVYYMLPARAGELLAGALVAMAVLRHAEQRIPKALPAPMAIMGLLLLLASFVLLNENQVFPGLRAILPTLGAALIIFAGHCAKNTVSRLLELKPMVWIGLVSYSAYLWHWPLLAFLRYEHIEINLFSGTVMFCVTFWLAFLSYMLIELPARESGLSALRVFLIQYAIPASLIGAIAIGAKYSFIDDPNAQPMKQAVVPAGVSRGEHAEAKQAVPLGESAPVRPMEGRQIETGQTGVIRPMSEMDTGLHDKPRPAYEFNYVCQPNNVTHADVTTERCVLGEKSAQPARVLLWGDSNAAHFVGVIGKIADRAGFKFRNIAVYSCPPLAGDPSAYVSAKRLDGCRNSLAPIQPVMRAADVVIIGAAWPDYVARSGQFYEDFFATVRSLTAQGKFVLIMGKIPIVSSFDINCREKADKSAVPIECAVKEPLSAEVREANARLKEFADRTPNVAYFDVTPYLCRDGLCSAYDGAGNALYYDTGHISMPASWKIGESIVQQEGVPKSFQKIREWLDKGHAR